MGTTLILVELFARHAEDTSSEEQQRIADEIMDRLRGIEIAGVAAAIGVNVTTLHRTHLQAATTTKPIGLETGPKNGDRSPDRSPGAKNDRSPDSDRSH